MGNDIEISKISNKYLRDTAKAIDESEYGNNNGIIDKDEVNIFEKFAKISVSIGSVSENDYKSVFGLEASNTNKSAATETANVTTNPINNTPVETTTNKKVNKATRNEFNKRINTAYKLGNDINEIEEYIDEKISNSANESMVKEAKELIAKYRTTVDLEKVINEMGLIKHPSTQEELEALKEAIKNCDGVAYSKITGRNLNYDIPTLTEAMEKYEPNIKTKADVDKLREEANKTYKGDKKDLANLLLDGTLLAIMKPETEKVINDLKLNYFDLTSPKVTQKELEALEKTIKNYIDDPKNGITCKEEVYDAIVSTKINTKKNHQALLEVVEEAESGWAKQQENIKNISEKDIKKAVQSSWMFGLAHTKANKRMAIMQKYLDEHKNADGTYDLTDLSNRIKNEIVGADVTINHSDDTQRAELYNIKLAMAEEMGCEVEDISDKFAKKFCELLGFEYKKDKVYLKDLANAGYTTASNAISGGAGAAIQKGLKVHVNMNQYQAQSLVLNLGTQTVANDAYQQLVEAGLDVTLSGTTITVLQEQGQNLEKTLVKAVDILKGVAIGAAIGLATSALQMALMGETVDFERTAFNTDDNQKAKEEEAIGKLEEYYISRYGKEMGTALFALRKCYNSIDEFYDYMRRNVAGEGSNLNKYELAVALKNLCKDLPEQPKPDYRGIITVKEIQIATPEEIERIEEENQKVMDEAKANEKMYNTVSSTWDSLAGVYGNCLTQKFGVIGANRVIKLVQCITDGNYSEERLRYLLKNYFNNNALRNEAGFDADAFLGTKNRKGIRNGLLPKQCKLPKSVAGCDRVEIEENSKNKWGTPRQLLGHADEQDKTGNRRANGGTARKNYDGVPQKPVDNGSRKVWSGRSTCNPGGSDYNSKEDAINGIMKECPNIRKENIREGTNEEYENEEFGKEENK